MHIIIIGAGNTGRELVATFCRESHDIVIIDTNQKKLDAVENQYDVLTVHGWGTDPDVLEEARIDRADMLVAVTSNAEVNILACALARSAGVRHKIARVTDPKLLHYDKLNLEELGVDLAVNQKEICARDIFNILSMPGALEIMDLQEGQVLAVGKRIPEGSALTAGPLVGFIEEEWASDIRLFGIMRGESMTVPHGDTVVVAGDEIYFVGRRTDCLKFMAWIEPNCSPFQKIIIAGAGSTGLPLAEMLEKNDVLVVLLEKDRSRAEFCSDSLNKAVVLNGDVLSQEAINNINIKEKTAFVAVTGDDESNIISCLLAARQGVDFTVARVNKPEYVPVINGLNLLDRAVNTHLAMINSISHFVRGENIKSVAMMHHLPGELLDVLITPNTKWANKIIRDLKIPKGAIITTISRDDNVRVATGDMELLVGDRLVLFALPSSVSKIESIFKS